MNNEKYFPVINFGSYESKKDSRVITESVPFMTRLSANMATTLTEVGEDYKNIYSQDGVGICTAASFINGVWNRIGKRYSEDFLYFLQKKYFDNVEINWTLWFEGSSPFTAIRAAYKFGLVPKEEVDRFFRRDPRENYSTYINRMTATFTPEIETILLSKAEKVITGYTQIGTDTGSLAAHVQDKKAFIINRYVCGNSWYSKIVNGVNVWAWSGNGDQIEPISEPQNLSNFPVSGHMVCLTKVGSNRKIANTFGPTWTIDGHAYVGYAPTEAWKVYVGGSTPQVVVDNKLDIKPEDFNYKFNNNLYLSTKYNKEVEMLQYVLMYENCMAFVPKEQRGYYGAKTMAGVINYQKKYNIRATGYFGPLTRTSVNSKYAK